MIRLICIRHGQTDWNRTFRIQGQQDSNLDELGIEQARLVGERLKTMPDIKAIYASDLKRAFHTAEAIAKHHPHLTIQPDQRLREAHFGDWETRLWPNVMDEEEDRVNAWMRDVTAVTPPNGESMFQFTDRVREFLNETLPKHEEGTVLIVSHGGTVRAIVSVLMNFPLKTVWRLGTGNTSIAELKLDEYGVDLVRLNDTAHLGIEN